MLVRAGEDQVHRRMRVARHEKGIGNQVETFDPVEAPEEQDDERVGGDPQPGAEAARYAARAGEIAAAVLPRRAFAAISASSKN